MDGFVQADRIKVKMYPNLDEMKNNRSGISTVIRAYYKYADDFGIDFVESGHDLSIVHGGMGGKAAIKEQCEISMLHGIYFTAQYYAGAWEWKANQNVIETIRGAISTTVPSDWVAATLQREFKIDPYVLPHGVDFDEWQHNRPYKPNQIFWGKNRIFEDVCDPSALIKIATRMPEISFVTTLSPTNPPPNITAIGILGPDEIKSVVQESAIVLSTIRETWGILYIEAMAAGTPVVSVNLGHVPHLSPHGVAGYCYNPGNIDDMERGIRWTLKNRSVLSRNAMYIAKQYPWQDAMKMLRQILELTRRKKDAIYSNGNKKAQK